MFPYHSILLLDSISFCPGFILHWFHSLTCNFCCLDSIPMSICSTWFWLKFSHLGRTQWQLGSLSHAINSKANGYLPLEDFPTEPPDPSVRDVEVCTSSSSWEVWIGCVVIMPHYVWYIGWLVLGQTTIRKQEEEKSLWWIRSVAFLYSYMIQTDIASGRLSHKTQIVGHCCRQTMW